MGQFNEQNDPSGLIFIVLLLVGLGFFIGHANSKSDEEAAVRSMRDTSSELRETYEVTQRLGIMKYGDDGYPLWKTTDDDGKEVWLSSCEVLEWTEDK